MARFSCPTCAAAYGVLRAAKVPKKAAKAVAYSSRTKRADKAMRRTKQVRKASVYARKLSKHLSKERAKAMKKNGEFKKGWNQARVMKAAHKCVKREMRR